MNKNTFVDNNVKDKNRKIFLHFIYLCTRCFSSDTNKLLKILNYAEVQAMQAFDL